MTFLICFYILLEIAGELLYQYSGDQIFRMAGICGLAFLPAVLLLAWQGRPAFHPETCRFPRLCRGLLRWSGKAALLWIFAVPVWRLYGFVFGEKLAELGAHQASLKLFALSVLLWFLAFSGIIYVRESLKRHPDENLLPVYHILNASTWMYFLAAVALGISYFGVPMACFTATLAMGAVSLLPCLELLLRMTGRLLLPRRRGRSPRRLLNLYCFELLANPGRITALFRDTMNRQLGLAAGGGQFLKLAGASAVPLLFLSLLLLWLLSGVVVLKPGFEALVLRFGRPTDRVLSAGLHFKAPWPMDTIRSMDVWKIRRIRVGSHRPKTEEEELYRDKVPILWTNNHGVTDDELLIVAPPRDMMNQVRKNEKTPSVSLIGADITVEYRIGDLHRYLLAGQDVKAYFEQLAMQISSRALFRYDVDELFCLGRIELPSVLHRELQQTCDRLKLGISVLHVGLGGVHPPQKVAADFQSTVSALQRKITIVEEARQEQINRLATVAGTVEYSRKLLESEVKFHDRSLQAEGQVAKILAEARGYRCEKANLEFGKSDRFLKERLLYGAAPKVYLNHRMMSSLEEGLKDSFKYMIIGDRDKMILRFRKNNENE